MEIEKRVEQLENEVKQLQKLVSELEQKLAGSLRHPYIPPRDRIIK